VVPRARIAHTRALSGLSLTHKGKLWSLLPMDSWGITADLSTAYVTRATRSVCSWPSLPPVFSTCVCHWRVWRKEEERKTIEWERESKREVEEGAERGGEEGEGEEGGVGKKAGEWGGRKGGRGERGGEGATEKGEENFMILANVSSLCQMQVGKFKLKAQAAQGGFLHPCGALQP
jgi:hypothetical protein